LGLNKILGCCSPIPPLETKASTKFSNSQFFFGTITKSIIKSFIAVILTASLAVDGFTIKNPMLFYKRGPAPSKREAKAIPTPSYSYSRIKQKRSLGEEPVQEEVVAGYDKRSLGEEPVQEEVVAGYD
jgi:hypothetical protein